MDWQSLEKLVAEGISVAEKYPEKFQPVILAEVLRSRLGGAASVVAQKKATQSKIERVQKPRKQTGGPRQKLLELKEGGFFNQPRLDIEAMEELKVRGFRFSRGSISARLLELAQGQLLRRLREPNGKRAVYKYQSIISNN